MKKIAFFILVSLVIVPAFGRCADDAAKSKVDTATAAAPSEAPVEDQTAAPADEAASTEAQAPADATAAATDNLEFVSGEIATVDEANKSLTVKLYGETENKTPEKTLSVKVDETTDITDGEKDRDLKSLTGGTEVDVEYDPATSKATYIFVY